MAYKPLRAVNSKGQCVKSGQIFNQNEQLTNFAPNFAAVKNEW